MSEVVWAGALPGVGLPKNPKTESNCGVRSQSSSAVVAPNVLKLENLDLE
jgi:hypothetical protein